MSSWLQYLVAFVIACHGFIYAFMPFVPDTRKVWGGRSWALGSLLIGGRLWSTLTVVHVAAGVAFMAAAVAIALAGTIPGWWRPLMVSGAVLGLVAFALFWDGQARSLAEQGAIGAAVSLLLLAVAVVFPAAFG
jgi:hypothetical protein